MTRQRAYHQRKPWIKFVCYARRRCNDSDPNSKNYPVYWAKGIKCTLTGDQAERLWKRDRAEKLTHPSLDREDATKDYTYENCRFIELDLNRRLPWLSKNPGLFDDEARARAEKYIDQISQDIGP